MIGQIKGILINKTPPRTLVDCNGIGYEIEVPMSTFFQLPNLGEQVTLLTYLVVREDAQLLYGFLTQQEKEMFKQLIKINGVGPKLALSILSGASVDELVEATLSHNSNVFINIPGIGSKTAERLVLELKDKCEHLVGYKPKNSSPREIDDIQNALISLGYSPKDASIAVKQLPQDVSINEGIREALKILSKKI
jgi:Holliday junction DNA helicase RuvA